MAVLHKVCSTIASTNIKRVFVMLEDVSGVLQRPAAHGCVMPAGEPSINQTPDYTDSEELSGSLDVIDQFKNAVGPGEASIPMYVRIPQDGGRMQGHDIFVSMMGDFQDRDEVTATISAAGAAILPGVDAASTVIPYQGASAPFPATGTIVIGGESIAYAAVTGTEFTGCVRGAAGTIAAPHGDGAGITLTRTLKAYGSAVAGSIGAGDTSIPYVTADPGFPAAGTVTVSGTGEEIAYTGTAGGMLTGCTRGANGTTAQAFPAGPYELSLTETYTATINAPGGTAAAGIDTDDTVIGIDNVTGGFFPRRGVVEIGAERIRYTSVDTDAQGVVTALRGCVRGFGGTTPANAGDGETVTLKSRVYHWDNCRPTLSIWMQVDHTVVFGSGGVVTSCEIPMSKTGGQHCDFTIQFRRMGWCGRGYVRNVVSANELEMETLEGVDNVQAYTEGGILWNHTTGDDNGGTGYTIVEVDKTRNRIRISPAPGAAWNPGDRIDPWLPENTPIGDPLESMSMKAFVDGVGGKLTSGSISLGTPTSFASEIGDEYPGENADGIRQLTMDNGIMFRAKDALELGRGYDGYDLRVDVVMGNRAGQTLSLAMPRVRFQMPSFSSEENFVTLTRTGAIMGTRGNDSLYIIQE